MRIPRKGLGICHEIGICAFLAPQSANSEVNFQAQRAGVFKILLSEETCHICLSKHLCFLVHYYSWTLGTSDPRTEGENEQN